MYDLRSTYYSMSNVNRTSNVYVRGRICLYVYINNCYILSIIQCVFV